MGRGAVVNSSKAQAFGIISAGEDLHSCIAAFYLLAVSECFTQFIYVPYAVWMCSEGHSMTSLYDHQLQR